MADVKVLENDLSREQLNELASEKGVESPEKFKTKGELAEKLSPLVTPEEIKKLTDEKNEDKSDSESEKNDSDDKSDQSDSSSLEPQQQADQRPDAQATFDDAAKVGREAAEENIAREADENTSKPGAENVTAKVTTSDAQKELKPEGDEMPETNVLGDDKAAQKANAGVKQGLEFAKENVAKEAEESTFDESGTQDPVAEGVKQAKINHRAEVKAAKEAEARRAGNR